MNKFFIVLGSIAVSLSIDTMTELNLIKEIANRGYKINMSELYRFINERGNKSKFLLLFIPGINIINSFIKMKKYEVLKEELLSNLDNTNIFIKMSDEEYQSYLDNPKSVSALNMSVNYSLKNENTLETNDNNNPKVNGYIWISNGHYKQIFNDGRVIEIYFRKEEENIVVTDIFGSISELSVEEQVKELNKIFKCLYNKKVIIEKKSDITIEKENLIEHRNDIINSLAKDEVKLTLK